MSNLTGLAACHGFTDLTPRRLGPIAGDGRKGGLVGPVTIKAYREVVIG